MDSWCGVVSSAVCTGLPDIHVRNMIRPELLIA